MPFIQKQFRSGVAANTPSGLSPGQLAVNTEIRRLWAGDANGVDFAAAPVLMTPITLYNPAASADYAEDDLVVFNGDLYKVDSEGSLVLYVPAPGAIEWPLHIQAAPVAGWMIDPEDGLILERPADARIQFVTSGTGLASVNFGDGATKERARIEWSHSVNNMTVQIGGQTRADFRTDQVEFFEQVRALSGNVNAPSLSFASDPKAGWFYAGSGYVGAASNDIEVMRMGPNYVQMNVPVYLNRDNNEIVMAFINDTDTGIREAANNDFYLTAGDVNQIYIDIDKVEILNQLDFEFGATMNFDTPQQSMIRLGNPAEGMFSIGYMENVSYGDVQSRNALVFSAGSDPTDGYMWGDFVGETSMSLSNRGVLQLREALWVGFEGNLLNYPTAPPSGFVDSSAGRTYQISGDTVVVVERAGDCYMSIIGSTAAGINFGNSSSETGFGIAMDMDAGEASLTVGGLPMLRMSSAEGVIVDAAILRADTVAVTEDFMRVAPLAIPSGAPDPGAPDSATNQLRAVTVGGAAGSYSIDAGTLPPGLTSAYPHDPGSLAVNVKKLLELLVEFGRETDARLTGIGA